jgi:hypothetical protein
MKKGRGSWELRIADCGMKKGRGSWELRIADCGLRNENRKRDHPDCELTGRQIALDRQSGILTNLQIRNNLLPLFIPHSAFRIPHSAFRIPHSAFRNLPAFPHAVNLVSHVY